MRRAMLRTSCQASRTISHDARFHRRIFANAKNPCEMRLSCIRRACRAMPSRCSRRRTQALPTTIERRRFDENRSTKIFLDYFAESCRRRPHCDRNRANRPTRDSHVHRLTRPRRRAARPKSGRRVRRATIRRMIAPSTRRSASCREGDAPRTACCMSMSDDRAVHATTIAPIEGRGRWRACADEAGVSYGRTGSPHRPRIRARAWP